MISAHRTVGAPGFVAALALAMSCLPGFLPASAGVELVLEDGQVVSGTTVELKDGHYLLELRTGSVLALPEELIRELRLTDRKPEVVAGQPIPDGAETAIRVTEPEILAGRPLPEGAPTGIRVGDPEVLAGPPEAIPFPTRAEQLAAFRRGESRFARGVIDPGWQPTDGWLRPGLTEFNPARWYRAPIDPTWDPEPAYTADSDVTEFSPARWHESAIDQRWYPEDGFALRDLWVGRDRSPFAGRFWVEDGPESGVDADE